MRSWQGRILNISLVLSLGLNLACSSKKVRLGDEFKHSEDDCQYVAAISKIELEHKEFTGESWPEKAREHSWDTAKGDAMANCSAGGFQNCVHVPAKDVKGNTGKDSGPGKYYYSVTVIGSKVKETPRSDEEIKRDQCQALDRCIQKRLNKGDDDDDLKSYRKLQDEKGCLSKKK